MNVEELNRISRDLSEGISVFYDITYQCNYSLGYTLTEKKMPSDGQTELADELHTERNLGSQWLIKDAIVIKNRIVPKLISESSSFQNMNRSLENGQDISDSELKKTLEELKTVISKMSDEFSSLKSWLKQINDLHDYVLSKETYDTEPDCYSWQDAAAKLERISNEGDRLNISWASLLQLVSDTAKALERSELNASDIIKKMFENKAAKQWEDVVRIANEIAELK